MSQLKKLKAHLNKLNKRLSSMDFGPPVTNVYNPLLYAKEPSEAYLERFLCGPEGRVLLLGMNPGPWGMAQTGVPFGEIAAVRDWLRIEGEVKSPKGEHPKRPVQGFQCHRSEVSGRRLWGFFADHFSSAEEFSERFLIFNYCPLIFLEESGRNRTPDKLPKSERVPLFEACDECLQGLLKTLKVEKAYGVGKFAEKRLLAQAEHVRCLKDVGSILHPSPANPAANRGWAEAVAPVLLKL